MLYDVISYRPERGRPRLTSGSAPEARPTTRCPMLGRYAPLFQKSLKPRDTLYTLPSEPQPDHKRIKHARMPE